jgi:hypothetical protein
LNAAVGHKNVKALVFVAAFAPETGKTILEPSGKFPGNTLGDALAAPVALSDGGVDLCIAQDKFRAQFAQDVPAEMAVTVA